MSKKADNILIIPGEVFLAMLMGMIDVRDWLEKEPTKYKILQGPQSIRIEALQSKPLKGPFGKFTRFFKVSAGYEGDIYEFKVEVYRRIYGLASALTDRELQILDKRLIQRKTVTDTAAEMKITPQAVSAFMTAIRKKVQKHLFKEEEVK